MNKFMFNVKDYPRLTQEKEIELLKEYKFSLYQKDKQKACDQLVYHNMGLIYDVIKKVCARSHNHAEMVSYGVEGFIIALDKYNLGSNAKLTTYAYNWVFKKVVEGNRADHSIQFPEYIWDGISKYTKAFDEFVRLNGVKPTNRPFSDQYDNGFISDMEKILTNEVENPMTLNLYKAVVEAMDEMHIMSYDIPLTNDEGKNSSLDEITEDKRISENGFQDELNSSLKEEFEKMRSFFGNKGELMIAIFELKLKGLTSSEIQRRLGLSRSIERGYEVKGMEFLRKSDTLKQLALKIV